MSSSTATGSVRGRTPLPSATSSYRNARSQCSFQGVTAPVDGDELAPRTAEPLAEVVEAPRVGADPRDADGEPSPWGAGPVRPQPPGGEEEVERRRLRRRGGVRAFDAGQRLRSHGRAASRALRMARVAGERLRV